MDIIKSKLKQCQAWLDQEIQYFSLSISEQAYFLEEKKRYGRARKKYIQMRNWTKVIEISRILKDYESMFYYQVKNKEWDQALHTVEVYELYHLGAPFCEERGLLNKAAHMYSYFNKIKAASLYKQLGLWDKAAECYMVSEQYFRALDCLDQLRDFNKKQEAYQRIERKTDELFKQKDYEKALKLYIRMKLWTKALEVAKITENTSVSKQIYEQLAHESFEEGYGFEAAQYLEKVHIPKAIHLYRELGYIEEVARLLVKEEKTEEAMHLLLEHHMIEKAEEIAEITQQYNLLQVYFKKEKEIEKLEEIYDKRQAYEEAVSYFIEQEELDLALKWIKKIQDPYRAAQLLEQIEKWEMAAHLYLTCGDVDLCVKCLEKANFTPEEIQHFIKVKNYPDSFSS